MAFHGGGGPKGTCLQVVVQGGEEEGDGGVRRVLERAGASLLHAELRQELLLELWREVGGCVGWWRP